MNREKRFNIRHSKSLGCRNRNIRYANLGSMKPQYRRMLRSMKAKEEQPAPNATAEAIWFLYILYILEGCDGSFYSGVTKIIRICFFRAN